MFLVFRAETHLNRANPTVRDFGNFYQWDKKAILAANEQEHAESRQRIRLESESETSLLDYSGKSNPRTSHYVKTTAGPCRMRQDKLRDGFPFGNGLSETPSVYWYTILSFYSYYHHVLSILYVSAARFPLKMVLKLPICGCTGKMSLKAGGSSFSAI